MTTKTQMSEMQTNIQSILNSISKAEKFGVDYKKLAFLKDYKEALKNHSAICALYSDSSEKVEAFSILFKHIMDS